MVKQKIFDYLKDCGCCDTCCLRFLKARGDEYENIEHTLQELNIKRNNKNEIDEEQQVLKRLRTNPCVTCLDFFSDEFQERLIKEIINCKELVDYECDKIVIALSMPIILQIRQISMWLALVGKFPHINKDICPDVPVKEAAKLIMHKEICSRLNKTYDQNGIMINIFINHCEEEAEMQNLLKVDQMLFKRDKKCKGVKDRKVITRNYLERNYIPSKISMDVFCDAVPVPPTICNSGLYLERITITGPTVFVAGRYKKLSRELSHSPWVLQGKRVMEDSIQELITRCIAPYFKVSENKIIFSSSGREDVDVRCLGTGRPFVLEIIDSHRDTIRPEEAATIELEIEKHPKISVQNLQIVTREELTHLKTGEEKKKKFYRALCVLKDPATPDILEKLNIPNGFDIEQITPIRVLHRRPLHKRPRTVYSVKAFVDRSNPKVVILDIITQAGTYIKELIHGEFGRTKPSISSIIGQWIDIIALDVRGIDLDWPKDVNNRLFLNNGQGQIVST